MPYDHRNTRNRVRAAALLKQLSGRLLDTSAWLEPERSVQDAIAFSHFRLANAGGVHVYPVGALWHVDIAFKNLPPGMHPVVRHPYPLASREEAMSTAIDQLSACAGRDRTPLPDRLTGLLGFQFDEVVVPVDYAMYARFKDTASEEGFDLDNTLSQLARLRHIATGGAPVTREAYEAAAPKVQHRIKFASCVAMALGMRVFTREDAVWDPDAELEDADETLLPPGPRH